MLGEMLVISYTPECWDWGRAVMFCCGLGVVGVCIRHYKYLSEKISTGLSNEEAAFMKTMQEIDTIYQAEINRASLEGEKRGRQKGRQEERTELILRLLNRRVGNLSIAIQTQIKALPVEQLGTLAEDLLDFSGLADLTEWLDRKAV
jgi:predicted transposase YdaD